MMFRSVYRSTYNDHHIIDMETALNPELFADNIGISVEDARAMLSLRQNQLIHSEMYRELVRSLDYTALSNSLRQIRALYETHLPELVDYLRDNHQYVGKGMTALTLGNWLLGFLNMPDYLDHLIEIHKKVPPFVLTIGLPRILEILDKAEASSAEWKKAMALLTLPMFAAQ